MDNILIDRSLRKSHQPGVSQRRQFWRKVARFHHNDLVRGRLQAQAGEVDNIVVWPPLSGKNKSDPINLHHRLSQARRLRRQQKNDFRRRMDWLTTERIECCAYGEWDGGAYSSLVTRIRSWSVSDPSEDNILRLVIEQPLQHFSTIAGTARCRIVSRISQNRRMGCGFHRALNALVNGSGLGAELKLLARVPVLLRQINSNLL